MHMRALLRPSCIARSAAAVRLPFILCASPPLAERALVLQSERKQHKSYGPRRVAKSLRDSMLIQTSTSTTTTSTNEVQQQDLQQQRRQRKKKGFNCIMSWCGAHQSRATSKNVASSFYNSCTADELRELDAVAVEWVAQSARFFSCAQSLVVLSFLCDVLVSILQQPQHASPSSSSASTSSVVKPMCRAIAAVLQHGVGDDAAELSTQSPTVLASALYGLHRLSLMSLSSSAVRASLADVQPPPSLYVRFMETLRNRTMMDDLLAHHRELGIEVLLTALYIISPERCAEMVPAAEVAEVLRMSSTRLHGCIVDTLPTREEVLLADGATTEDANTNTNTMSMSECSAIINHAVCNEIVRADLIQYLFCVRRAPSQWSSSDAARLAQVLALIPRSHMWLSNSIVARTPYTANATTTTTSSSATTRAILMLVPFVSDASAYLRQRGVLTADGRLATSLSLRGCDARRMMGHIGTHLTWNDVQRWIRTAVGEEMYQELRKTTTKSSNNNNKNSNNKKTVATRASMKNAEPCVPTPRIHNNIPLTPSYISLLRFLMAVVMDEKASTSVPSHIIFPVEANATSDTTEDVRATMRSWAQHIFTCIDWSTAMTHDADADDDVEHECNGTTSSPITAAVATETMEVYVAAHCLFLWPCIHRIPDQHLLANYANAEVFVKHTSGYSVERRLYIISKLLNHDAALLTSHESRQTLLMSLLTYNCNTTMSSIFRFLRYLAPTSSALRCTPTEVMAALAARRNVDPRTYQRQRFELGDAGYIALYAEVLLHAMPVLTCSEEWGVNRAITENLQRTLGSWTTSFFFTLAADRSARIERSAVSSPTPPPPTTTTKMHDDDHDGESPLSSPTTMELERVLSYAIVHGAQLGDAVAAEVFFRLKEAISATHKSEDENKTHADDDDDDDVVVVFEHHVVFRGAEEATARYHNAVELLPLPAHFLVMARTATTTTSSSSSSSSPSTHHQLLPLSTGYLTHLLERCEPGLFVHVFSAFRGAVHARRAEVVGADVRDEEVELQLVRTALGVALSRARGVVANDGSSSSATTTRKEKMASPATTPRSISAVLLPILRACIHGLGTPAPTSSATEDEQKPAHQPNTTTTTTPTTGSVIHEEVRHDVEQHVTQLISFMKHEEQLTLAWATLRVLTTHLPAAAEVLFLLVHQRHMDHLTHAELLRLCCIYPPSASVVVERLRVLLHEDDATTTTSSTSTLVLEEVLRQSKHLPMSVIASVVMMILHTATFAWCARLLSALAPRHAEVPLTLLTHVVERVEEVSDSASGADRNLLLLILQSYLVEDGTSNNNNNNNKKMKDDDDDVDDGGARRAVLQRCLDALLLLHQVVNATTLHNFLVSYPTSFLHTVRGALEVQVRQHIIPSILPAPDDVAINNNKMKEDQEEEQQQQHDVVGVDASTAAGTRVVEQLLPLVQLLTEYDVLTDEMRRDVRLRLRHSQHVLRDAFHCNAKACSTLLFLLHKEDADVVVVVHDDDDAKKKDDDDDEDDSLVDWLRRSLESPSEKLILYSSIVEHLTSTKEVHASTSCAADALCVELWSSATHVGTAEFAKLMLFTARARRWHLLKHHDGDEDEVQDAKMMMMMKHGTSTCASILREHLHRADAHSRCIMIKAAASHRPLFAAVEEEVMTMLVDDVPDLAHEDLELILATCLLMAHNNMMDGKLEALLDVIGSRLSIMLARCRSSTLLRLIRCHAVFHVEDDALMAQALYALAEQVGNHMEIKLDVSQVLMLLTSVVELKIPSPPERLVVACFIKLEKHVEQLQPHQLTTTGQLLVDLEMAYTPTVSTLVSRLLESREGLLAHHPPLRRVVELLCDEYDADGPLHLRSLRLRKRRHQRRLAAYLHSCSSGTQHDVRQ